MRYIPRQATGEGHECAQHGFRSCGLEPLETDAERLDVLLTGLSCAPASTARAQRWSGAGLHKDADMGKYVLQL